MRRPTGFSAFSSLLRASLTSAFVLAAVISCSSDNLAPKTDAGLDPSTFHLISVPDSVKLAYYASHAASPELSSNVMAGLPARISANSLAATGSCSSGGSALSYTKSAVDFVAESDAANAVPLPRDKDDGWVPVPIGFDFNFYGNTYNNVNLYLNGFITFGAGVDSAWFVTGSIPYSDTPNNMISLAWNDWNPGKVAGSLRYETRGIAPNRKFLIQFKGVPEVFGTGKLTSMLELSEGSNEITIYTTSFTMTYLPHRMTQGIESPDGANALFFNALTPA